MVGYIRGGILMIDNVVVAGVDFSAIRYIISRLRILYNCLNLNY
jgi:hypothetical protein